MFKWLFHILIFATKYQNKEKPLKRQRKLGLALMVLYAPFPLCNMTTFRKILLPLIQLRVQWCVFGQNICYLVTACVIHFYLICNVTSIFWTSLIGPPPCLRCVREQDCLSRAPMKTSHRPDMTERCKHTG